MSEKIDAPVVSEDMTAAFLAAIKRAESVPAGLNLIDTMSDDEWLSDDCDTWNINAGSDNGNGETDGLDSALTHAA